MGSWQASIGKSWTSWTSDKSKVSWRDVCQTIRSLNEEAAQIINNTNFENKEDVKNRKIRQIDPKLQEASSSLVKIRDLYHKQSLERYTATASKREAEAAYSQLIGDINLLHREILEKLEAKKKPENTPDMETFNGDVGLEATAFEALTGQEDEEFSEVDLDEVLGPWDVINRQTEEEAQPLFPISSQLQHIEETLRRAPESVTVEMLTKWIRGRNSRKRGGFDGL